MKEIISKTFKQLNLSTIVDKKSNSGTFDGSWIDNSGSNLISSSPIDNSKLAEISLSTDKDYENTLQNSIKCYKTWKTLPAPQRGEIVRQIAVEIRKHKDSLANLITLEVGKIKTESLGEIQEVIDIADFAVGLSRQLYGNSMHSERPNHRMYEQWHPIGPVAVISAFNFPAAVWAWNAMIAAVCGDTVIWKPSELAPLTAIAMNKICADVATKNGYPSLFTLLTDDKAEMGIKLSEDKRVPLVSATGSCRMGRIVGATVAKRFGRSLLELGGNNAIIVCEDADIELASRGIVFGAVGTAGQRCTTTRRLFVHKNIKEELIKKLKSAYSKVKIGSPLDEKNLLGPLINQTSVDSYKNAITKAKEQGAKIIQGGNVIKDLFVEPTIVDCPEVIEVMKEETFAPILYILEFEDLDKAIEMQNDVPQGLSSAIFTNSVKKSEYFLSVSGSDCGIANVNIGTSGAEIGGAFGGEKETGGGREAGSDSWKAYMRRQTNTINWSDELPLAQGVKFE